MSDAFTTWNQQFVHYRDHEVDAHRDLHRDIDNRLAKLEAQLAAMPEPQTLEPQRPSAEKLLGFAIWFVDVASMGISAITARRVAAIVCLVLRSGGSPVDSTGTGVPSWDDELIEKARLAGVTLALRPRED